jgi:molecular chaperone GrpE
MPDENHPLIQETDLKDLSELEGDDEIEIIFEDDEDGAPAAAEADAAGFSGQPDPGELTRLNEEVSRLQAEQEHLRELYLRKLAEFDNFRKRTEREREDLKRIAGEGIVRDLVPVLDNFERALQHTGDEGTGAFRQGVEMIAKQLWDALERKGMGTVDPLGQPFEPELHEAVQRVEGSGKEPGTVVWVLARGYTFCDRLVRPAMVGVAVETARPEAAESGPAEADGGEGAGSS